MKHTLIIALFLSMALPVLAQNEKQNDLEKNQDCFSIEIRPGIAFPTKDLVDTKYYIGFGFEGNLVYRFMPHLSAYAGWGGNKFCPKQSLAGSDVDFVETGYTFGLQFIHPISETSLSYLISGGGIYNHIEIENKDGKIISDSKHGLGWQVETGLVIPIADNIHITPSVRYRSLSRDTKINTANMAVNLNYISGGVSLKWSY